MSDKLTFVYRHHPQPGRAYYVQELGTGICCQHEDPALALQQFESIDFIPICAASVNSPQMKSCR
jgi:hypothetical protein